MHGAILALSLTTFVWLVGPAIAVLIYLAWLMAKTVIPTFAFMALAFAALWVLFVPVPQVGAVVTLSLFAFAAVMGAMGSYQRAKRIIARTVVGRVAP